MFIKQSDLLWGLDNSFVKKFIDSSMKKAHPKGYTLFSAGDAADFFYILVRGSIRLSIGEGARTTYLIEHAGDAFGWSGLVGLERYSTTAECLEDSIVMIFAKEFVTEVAESEPENGLRFFRRLARMLGHRLLYTYEMIDVDLASGQHYAFDARASTETHAG